MAHPEHFVKGLGLLDATMIVAGSMIGSGIFIVSADIARQVGSPGWLMVVWGITAVVTLMGALCIAELAAMMPKAGGLYVYLRESFGPLMAFLYGWTLFTVIQTGTIAAVAVGFAKFLGLLWPAVSAEQTLLAIGGFRFTAQQAVAIAVIAFLTALNTRGLWAGKLVQNAFTLAKVAALLGLVGLGLLFGPRAGAALSAPGFWTPVVDGAVLPWSALLIALGTAMVGSIFAADAWNTITFTAGEVKRPARDLPLSLGIGVGGVLLIYMLANLAYLNTLPLSAIQQAPDDRVGTAVAQAILGPAGGTAMAIAILVSTFGCINGIVLGGARVYWAMSKDGLFFKAAGHLSASGVPAVALWTQGLWAAALTLTGSYGQLLDYTIFATLLFYVLTTIGLFMLRRRRPDAERPYRVIGYPVVPALYILGLSVIMVVLLAFKPTYTWPGLGIVLAGLPVYFLWRRVRHAHPEEAEAAQ